MKNTNFSKMIKRAIRESVNARNNCPVVIVDGDMPPTLCGRSYYFTNKSGHKIRHPSAYRKAWGKPIYNPSTIRVEVGSSWLLYNFTDKNLKLLKTESNF